MANTPNYNLLKPSPTGNEDVHQSLSDNFTIIDTQMKANDTKAQSVKSEVEKARITPDGATQEDLQAAIRWVYDRAKEETLGTEITPIVGVSPSGAKFEITFDDGGGVVTTSTTKLQRELVGISPNGTRYEITFEEDGDIVATITSKTVSSPLIGVSPSGTRYEISFEDDGDLVTTVSEAPLYAMTTTEVISARTDENNLTSSSLKVRLDGMGSKVGILSSLKTLFKTNIVGSINEIWNKVFGNISVEDYSSYVVGDDWTEAFNQALSAATGKTVLMEAKTYNVKNLVIPDSVKLKGRGHHPDKGTVLNYIGTEGGWMLRTGGTHERNHFQGFRMDLNGLANGLLIGDIGANLAGNIPTDFKIKEIAVADIGSSYTGMKTINASHYEVDGVRIGYGATSGKGFSIYADMYNSGVAKFTDSSLGRLSPSGTGANENSIGLEIDGTVNLDAFEFDNSCYFGGKTPVKIGSLSTFIRNVKLSGHAECRNSQDPSATKNVVELTNVLGINMDGFTFAGFGAANTSGLSFKGNVEGVNVKGCEANGIMGYLFKDDGAALIQGGILQKPRLTNGSTATDFSTGFTDEIFKMAGTYISHKTSRFKYIQDIDGSNKEYWGSTPDATQSHTRGDFIKNRGTLNPQRTKNILGWKAGNTASAGSNTFYAYGMGWGTLAERPTMTANDMGYSYKATDTGVIYVWDGTTWV